MPTVADCEREIRELHEFFVEYYAGKRDDLERLERALGDGFQLIHPDGNITDRDAVLRAIRETYDTYDPGEFQIEIRNVEPVEIRNDRALMRYEEWQNSHGETTGRLSTVYFAPPKAESDEPPRAEWRYLQETWLDAPTE